ncbi:nitrilase family protein [Paraburkholderia humisilvae]|uniref:N-carbamoyl-D-amino acid hydrolase n=1 Tax=Paraburkholderia humisilvae TaxID=627669 RepID=A0A6J5E8G9_9BURK|nr:nitrilase family protein [Paraburkholderia humisilvae]CAB3761412.1 N-carbamoyl-D-amino acid hydrolase [Paraburkholderia humisilvae]
MTAGNESRLGVACIQMQPEVGAKSRNVAHATELIEQAHARGARLIVLPELCNTGYVFESREEAFALSETLDGGETIRAWASLATRLDVTLVAGYAERDGDVLYNSAAIIGPRQVLGNYRKLHLWGDEHLFFEPGNLGVPVFHTPFGRVACAICYDIWFPEVFRLAANRGADILCVPTNWVPMPAQPDGLPVMANLLAMAGAHSNGLFVAAADRVGHERGQPFLGCSVIVDAHGWPVAGPASATDEAVLVAQVNLADARRHRQLNAFNHVLRDRRPEVYRSGGDG